MNKRHSNLLAMRFRTYLLVRRRLIQWSFVWTACLLASLVWWRVETQSVLGLAERVALQETRSMPLQKISEENARIRQQLQDMNSHESLLVQLDDEQVPYHLLALVSTQVKEREGDVRIETFQILRAENELNENGRPSRTKPTPEDANSGAVQLSLGGLATDNLAVSLFVAGLRDCGVFQAVDLKSSVGARKDSDHTQSFTIQCTL